MSKEFKYSLIIAGLYLLFGTLWIIFSDAAVAGITKDAETFRRISNYKGIAFVLVSSILILGLVSTYYKRYVSFQAKYNEINSEDERIFEHLPIGATILNLDGKITKVNRGLCSLLGYTEEEFLKLNSSFFTPDAQHNLFERVMAMPDVPCHANISLQKKDGTTVWCLVNCILIKDASENCKHYILNVLDIDRELRMQQRVLKLNEDLLNAQRLGKFGHWHYNYAGHKMILSTQAAEVLDLHTVEPSAEEIVGLFDKKLIEEFTQQLDSINARGGRIYKVMPLRKAEFGVKHIEVEAELALDEADGSLILKGTLKDVTQVMILQYEKENFNKSLVNWAFKLSHELRKPISSILGVSQLMNEKLVEQHELEGLHKHLQKAAEELDEQTRDLAEQFHYMQTLLKESPKDVKADANLIVLPGGDLRLNKPRNLRSEDEPEAI